MLSTEAASEMAVDFAACGAMLRSGSRTFFAASHVLPWRVSGPATALYAYCRIADDAVDREGGKRAALALLHERLDRAYRGMPFPTPADRAFADTVARFAIPRALPDALLEGLAWDVEGRRYEDLSALKSYAVRVAGAVGAMMSILMGARTPPLLARACDLGVAMQLTNIARDVGEDAHERRLYLPLQWLRAANIDPDAWLARPVFNESLEIVVRQLLNEADTLYLRSACGIAGLPLSCRPGIHAARLLYAEIGREVERRGFDSVSCRAVVPWRRKVPLLAQSLACLVTAHTDLGAPPLAEAQFLIDAVVSQPAPQQMRRLREGISKAMRDRLIWVIDLFEQLERREQFGRDSNCP
jgi:15-cis-phytoene synthase